MRASSDANPMADSRIAPAVAAVAEQGFAIVPDAIPIPLCRDLIAALERVEREHAHGFGQTSFEGNRTVRIYNLLRYGSPFTAVPAAEPVRSIAEQVLGEDLLLSSLSAITLAPGQEAQALHSDSQLISLRRPHPCLMLNAFWVLSDFTEVNGATRLVPGSHKNPKPPKFGETYETVPAKAPAGSIILFDSQLWHGGGGTKPIRDAGRSPTTTAPAGCGSRRTRSLAWRRRRCAASLPSSRICAATSFIVASMAMWKARTRAQC